MPKKIGAGSSGGGRGASGASKGVRSLASSLVGKAGSVSRVGGGVSQAAKNVAARVPNSGVSRAPVSLPPGPKVPSGSGGRLYSEKPYSDQSIIGNYKEMIGKGSSPEQAVSIIQFATRASAQPRTTSEIRRIVGLG